VTGGAWDTAYAEGARPTWDIGRPQPAVARLLAGGAFGPRGAAVLDAGCGTGDNAVLLAAHGYRVVGLDIAWEAIARARAKAAERDVDPRPVFITGDALVAPSAMGLGPFDAALDVGLFHALPDGAGPRYAASLASVVRPGGRAFVICWSARNPFGIGPRRVTRRELRATFRRSTGWRVDSIEPDELASRLPGRVIHAWVAQLTRRA
jgi:SAM-dependent methyltransferase